MSREWAREHALVEHEWNPSIILIEMNVVATATATVVAVCGWLENRFDRIGCWMGVCRVWAYTVI